MKQYLRILLSIFLIIVIFISGCVSEEQMLEETTESGMEETTTLNQADFEREIKYGTVAIFVTRNVYDSLSTEIDLYKQDIVDEWNNKYQQTDVTIIKKDSFSKEDIKNEIKNLWKNKNLTGVILIGNLPHYTFKPTKNLATTKDTPSDFYYVDVEDTCDYPDSYTCTKNPKIWLGRITPPLMNDVALLKEYFDRNHAYRNGEINYNNKILMYSPNAVEETKFTKQNIIEQIKGEYEATRTYYVENKFLFEDHKIILSDIPNSEDDISYFNELRKPYKYVFYYGHGTPTFSQFKITSDIIEKNKPQGLFYALGSCSNGDFTQDNYNAGWYLFSGGGLVVDAGTVPIYAIFPPAIWDDISYLERGLSFGELLGSSQHFSSTILGDPTLHIYDKIGSEAEFKLSNISIDLGNIKGPTEISIQIKNAGSETLKLLDYNILYEGDKISSAKGPECEKYPIYIYEQNEIAAIISPCNRAEDFFTFNVEPNNIITIDLTIVPYFDGENKNVVRFLTNDKYYPFIKIPIKWNKI